MPFNKTEVIDSRLKSFISVFFVSLKRSMTSFPSLCYGKDGLCLEVDRLDKIVHILTKILNSSKWDSH